MARNEEKHFGLLNRLVLQKEKEVTYCEAKEARKKAEANTDVEQTDSEKLGRGFRGLKRKRKHRIEEYVATSSDSEVIEDPPSFMTSNEVVQKDAEVEDFRFTSEKNPAPKSESLLGHYNTFCQHISSASTSGSLHLKPSSKRRNLTPSFDSGSILGIPAEEQKFGSDCGHNEPSSQGASSYSELLHREPKTKLDSGSTVTIPTEDFLNMVRDIQILESNQKRIMDMLETILSKINHKEDFHLDEDMSKIIDLLPLKNEEDITQLEMLLIQEEFFQKLLKYLKGIGGSKVDQAVKLILRRLLKDSLACNYSFLGQKGKKPFQRLKIYEAILGAVQQNYLLKDVQEVEVENSVKNWLRHAKARCKGSDNP